MMDTGGGGSRESVSSKMCVVCMCAHMCLCASVMSLESVLESNGLDFNQLLIGTLKTFEQGNDMV